MSRERGIRSRILAAFTAFAGCVAILFAAAGHAALYVIEDSVNDRQLAAETDRVRRFVEQHGALPPPSPFFTAHLGAASLPPALRDAAARLSPGRHELDARGRELFVSRTPIPGRAEPLFVVYELRDAPLGGWMPTVVLGALAVLLGGVAVGAYTARRMARPLSELAEVVQTTPPSRLADALAERRLDHELQVLADRLVESLRAHDAHAARDQRFTRYASHELRSPVAVIKGAAELLRATPEAAERRVRRPLARIERAAADMEAIIEAFLWLARERSEDVSAESSPPAALVPIVEQVVERYRYLAAGKPVEIRIERRAAPAVAAPPAVIAVVIGNLVANALHYTERGEVAITVEERAVVVADTGPGMNEEQLESFTRSFVAGEKSVGYGLGLSIVLSLCDRFGWKLEIHSEVGAGTRATLKLAPRPR
ncbi:sensor histidine kinase [Sorangium sp. So ce1128]